MNLFNLLLAIGLTLNFIGMTLFLITNNLVGLIYSSVLFLSVVIVILPLLRHSVNQKVKA